MMSMAENCLIFFCKILLKLQLFSVKATLTCKFCRKQDIGFTQRVAYLEMFLLTYIAIEQYDSLSHMKLHTYIGIRCIAWHRYVLRVYQFLSTYIYYGNRGC